MQSMTGYAKTELSLDKKDVFIESRSLNSKQLDITINISSSYKQYELEIRKFISKKLKRGKIDLKVWIENTKNEPQYSINKQAVKTHYQEILKLQSTINNKEPVLPVIFKIPDVIVKRRSMLHKIEWKKIKKTIESCVLELEKSRKKEGEKLYKDINKNIKAILKYLKRIQPLTDKRVKKIRQKLLDKISNTQAIDKNRLEQEIVYYIEKQDINEEQVRLSSHIAYFIETMNKSGATGKKLIFIAQEIGREINTISSKAGDAKIQKIVVEIKAEVEKIKEQLMNIL